MALVNMRDMLYHAYHNGYAVGAFDLVSLDFLEGIIKAAERCNAPVILSLAESHFEYFDFEITMPTVLAAAKRSSIPVAIHLDHGESLESAVQGINLGCNGVMVDASRQTLTDNIKITRAVAEMAHACGVPVEGELGYVPGVEGEDAERHPGEISYTTASDAKEYVAQNPLYGPAPDYDNRNSDDWSVRKGNLKAIERSGEMRIYNLKDDEAEQNPLRHISDGVRKALRTHRPTAAKKGGEVELDEEERAALRRLGYIAD